MDELLFTTFYDEGDGEGGGGNPNPNPNPNPTPDVNDGNNPAPSVKTFTQAELDDIVVKRLGKERARFLKKFNVEDESDLDAIIENLNGVPELKKELDTLRSYKLNREYGDVLKEMNIAPDFIDYALTKIDAGENLDTFKENAKAFVEANPKMLSENFDSVNSNLNLGGNPQPNISEMTTEQYLEWRKKNSL